jgi:hypothetical protein
MYSVGRGPASGGRCGDGRVRCRGLSWHRRRALAEAVCRQHVDSVLTKPGTSYLACVVDSSGNWKHRAAAAPGRVRAPADRGRLRSAVVARPWAPALGPGPQVPEPGLAGWRAVRRRRRRGPLPRSPARRAVVDSALPHERPTLVLEPCPCARRPVARRRTAGRARSAGPRRPGACRGGGPGDRLGQRRPPRAAPPGPARRRRARLAPAP